MMLWPETYHVTIQRLIPRCRQCSGRVLQTTWARDDIGSCYRVDFSCHGAVNRLFIPYSDIVIGVREQTAVRGQEDWPLARLIVQWFTTGPGEVF